MVQSSGTRPRVAHVGSLGTAAALARLSDIHMLLAPLALTCPSYSHACLSLSGESYTILDSGALELSEGTSCTDIGCSALLDLSIALHVSEVVASDAPGDPQGSLQKTIDFIMGWRRLPDAVRPRLMVVPHGHSIREWLDNALVLVKRAGPCTVGIPRLVAGVTHRSPGRARVRIAEQLRTMCPAVSIHLLGGGRDFLLELDVVSRTNAVRSIDSTFVHRYCMSGADPEAEYIAPRYLACHDIPANFTTTAVSLDAMMRRRLGGGAVQ